MKEFLNVSFKKVEGHELFVDIYVPAEKKPPLIMWIAWWRVEGPQ